MNQKLTLNKQTIAHLDRKDLNEVKAGVNIACADNLYTYYKCDLIRSNATAEAVLEIDALPKVN